ncbi:MAG: ParA family protein [Gammaproteobacteria bacterium]|nr:ParA family protein [Gammaproteobacteria bacterium]
MKTVAIINQKGGSGKSTIAECLAVAAYLDGQAAAILDMDPQGTCYMWGKRRLATAQDVALTRGGDTASIAVNPPVISVTQANYKDEWERLSQAGADLVVIDTPARLDTWALNAADLADLVIIPSKPTIKDLERVESSIKLACMSEIRPVFVILNQTRPQGDRTTQAEEFIKARHFPVCSARLGFRVAFEDADTLGQTPQETEPGGKAAKEIQAVYHYTSALMHPSCSKEVNNGN